jgi:phosphoserine phosphatase
MERNVLTLVAAPDTAGLWDRILPIASSALARLGAEVEPVDWLAPAIAGDLCFGGLNVEQAETAVRAALENALGGLPIDLVAQPRAGRRKRLLLADMEATVIANEMLDELADLLGLGERITAITQRAMNGGMDFAAALRERVALLRGVPVGVLSEAAGRIRINPGARELVATMRANGAYAALVSGGFRTFTGPVRRELGFDIDIANELVLQGTQLAGTVREPILGREAKLAALKALAADRGVALAEAIAVGDGANDLPMLEAAGLGIAYHAKPVVIERARHRIDHGDLSALLYIQGYRAAEIIRVKPQ